MDTIRITEYFSGRSVLVLGCTGFLGKCLLEKLTRSVPTLDTIYCLIRSRKNRTATQRLNDVLLDPIFTQSQLKRKNVVAIEGDLLNDNNLGISSNDYKLIKDNVTCIYNVAGSSKLDDNLKICFESNVITLFNVLNFSQKLSNVKCMVCISSIYTNYNQTSHLEERIYDHEDIDPLKIMNALKWMTDEMIDASKNHLMKDISSTFIYCKLLSECLIRDLVKCNRFLPIVLIRPSMIGATYREPFPGWIDENATLQPGQLLIGTAKGYLRTMKGQCLDIIPVDVLASCLIASSVYTCYHKLNKDDYVIVYHCSNDNSLKTNEFAKLINKVASHNVPFEKAFRRPNLSVTGSSLMHSITTVYSHFIPALIGDVARALLLKKPYLIEMYKKLHKNINLVESFTDRSWELSNQNMQTLHSSLCPDDINDFFVDPASINWPQYIEGFLKGTKLFLLKEQDCYINNARRHLKTLRNLRWTFNFFLLAFFWRYFIAKSQIAVNLWSVVLSSVYRFTAFLPIASS